jgi:hypothetical protein
MRREPGKALGQHKQVKVVLCLKSRLSNPMLLRVMLAAQADSPAIRWFEAHCTIAAFADMRAFDGSTLASFHDAVMSAHPSAVTRARAGILRLAKTRDPLRQ